MMIVMTILTDARFSLEDGAVLTVSGVTYIFVGNESLQMIGKFRLVVLLYSHLRL